MGVDSAIDLDAVERVTLDVARTVLRTVPDLEPWVRFVAFGESSIDLSVGSWLAGEWRCRSRKGPAASGVGCDD